MTLSVKLPPLARGTEIFLFLLIVPPLAVYALAAVASRYFSVRADRARIFAAKMVEQLQAEKECSLGAVSVELSQWPAQVHPPAVASTSAAGEIIQ